jgi:hypothetical protein
MYLQTENFTVCALYREIKTGLKIIFLGAENFALTYYAISGTGRLTFCT